MDLICLDTHILIAHKRAKIADKDQTVLYRFATQGYRFALSSITLRHFERTEGLVLL